jgi:hypothetical protein
MRFKPEKVAHLIAPRPVLIIYAEHDAAVPSEEPLSCYKALGEPKKIVMLPKANHYESYRFVNPELFEISMPETLAWYREYL